MNSKFKFRFWCKGTSNNLNFNKKGWWTYPNFLLDKYFAGFDIFESKDFVTCQFTGLFDKNNKEIYEGDIVRLTNPAHSTPDLIDETWVKEESVVVKIVQDKTGEYYGKTSPSSGYRLIDYPIWEVIGNIYENPKIKLK